MKLEIIFFSKNLLFCDSKCFLSSSSILQIYSKLKKKFKSSTYFNCSINIFFFLSILNNFRTWKNWSLPGVTLCHIVSHISIVITLFRLIWHKKEFRVFQYSSGNTDSSFLINFSSLIYEMLVKQCHKAIHKFENTLCIRKYAPNIKKCYRQNHFMY